jgi:hypothetical protein
MIFIEIILLLDIFCLKKCNIIFKKVNIDFDMKMCFFIKISNGPFYSLDMNEFN